MLEVARQVTPHIAYYLPRNIDISEVVSDDLVNDLICQGLPLHVQLVSAVTNRESIEVEQHFLNRKLKTLTAYFGELVKEQQEDEDEEEYN